MGMYIEDTIAAISTPPGVGGIGVIRLSGKKAIGLVEGIFKSRDKQKLSKIPSHTVHFGHIIDQLPGQKISARRKKSGQPVVDDVLITVMRAPHSYTGEDVVEISCHGGPVILEKILSLVLANGAKPASGGEFTKRAFLNGRLDLIQAEAVSDMINAKTEASLKIAIGQLHGHLSSTVNKIRDKLVDILASLEAVLDYPEEEVPAFPPKDIIKNIDEVSSLVAKLISTAQSGKIFREGLKLVIVGKPNTGKSTLLNTLLQEDKAIVTPIAGTTRDVIEDWLNIDGVPLKIMDTAGLKNTRHEIEKLGIERTKKAIETADLILLVLDLSSPLTKEDEYIAELITGKKYIVVANKSDLPSAVKERDIKKIFSAPSGNKPAGYSLVKISALQGSGIHQLNHLIYKAATGGQADYPPSVLVTNVRHKEALRRAVEALAEAKKACKNKASYEFVALDLREALKAIGEINGQVANEEILEQIFSKFCIGK
ncbi:MAG: tRNA uridine-5-carboxymethylaminomethyl(34) synthesis GTPase MnmE [bacterium]